MTPKEILQAIGILSKAPASEVAKMLADHELNKAAESLTASEMVDDRWQAGEMHAAVSREEIKTGPVQAATGGNAEKQIREYSNVAPQHLGINEQAETLARLISPIAAASKAQTAALGTVLESLKSLNAVVVSLVTVKAEKKEEGEEGDEDEETVKASAAKAKSLIVEAKALLVKAKKAEGEAMMVEDDEEEEKACKKKARTFRKSASRTLGKALSAAFVAGDVELRKAIRAIAAKADINVAEEDDEDEDEKEKAKAAAAKAVADATAAAEKAKGGDAKGNQADSANKDGNQSDTAVKAMAEKVDEALKGLGMLQMNLSEMMGVVSGRSKGTGAVPDFAKATVDATIDLNSRIDTLEESGQMSQTDAFAARDILSKMNAVRLGKLDPGIVQDRIAKSTHTVQMLFKAATPVAA